MTDRIITGIDVGTYQVKVVIVRVPMKKQGEHTLPPNYRYRIRGKSRTTQRIHHQ